MAQHDEQGRLIREIKPLEGMRKVIAERMTFSKHEYPQGTGQVRLSVDKLIQFRKELLEKKGIKVSFGDLYVKAAACALEENMALNASRQKERIIYYEDINLTVQATINGVLMEPVVEHADRKDIEEISAELDMPVDKVREIMRVAQEPVSLETPIGEEEDSHLGDFIPDDEAPVPAEAASQTLLKEQLADVLKTLTPREEEVLRLRFGLKDGRPRTLEEVGKVFNVTRERIRQIEAKALRKLRHPSRSKKLRDFLD